MRNVVVRSHLAGVHYGTMIKRDGDVVTLRNARRAWSWSGALSCSELATKGPGKESKICATVTRVIVLGAIEIVDASDVAAAAWQGAPEATT